MDSIEQYEEAARKLGAEHGKAKGSWVLDGNSSSETAQRIVAMIDDGDPELWDMYAAPLSGEWADEPTPNDILEEIEYEGDDSPESWDSIIRAYEEAHSLAWSDEVERTARIYA